jgi:hypothetical protein
MPSASRRSSRLQIGIPFLSFQSSDSNSFGPRSSRNRRCQTPLPTVHFGANGCLVGPVKPIWAQDRDNIREQSLARQSVSATLDQEGQQPKLGRSQIQSANSKSIHEATLPARIRAFQTSQCYFAPGAGPTPQFRTQISSARRHARHTGLNAAPRSSDASAAAPGRAIASESAKRANHVFEPLASSCSTFLTLKRSHPARSPGTG